MSTSSGSPRSTAPRWPINVSGVFALVEYENGEMAEVSPRKIKFLDGKEMFEARFFEENQEKREEE